MAVELTPNGVRDLMNGAPVSGEGFIKPIVQVIDVRKVANERFRVVVSDGTHVATGMVSQAMNSRVAAGEIIKYSLMQVLSCSINDMGGRKIMIIMEFVVLGNAGHQIGAPVPLVGAGIEPMGGGAAGGAGAGGYDPAPHARAAGGSSGVAMAPGMGPSGMGGAGRPGMGAGGGARPAGPTIAAAAPSAFTPIAALTTFNQRWTIKARVVNKGDMRSWNNARGSGTLFSVTLVDESGGEIRGTFFKDGASKYFPMLQVGKVYTFANGKVKMANMQYTSVKNECEISFDEKSVVHEVADDARIARAVFNFIKLSALESTEPGKMVDVCGVVTNAPPPSSIASKKNPSEMLDKRDLTLTDDSNAAITLTLWGDKARDMHIEVGNIMAVKGVKLGDFGGRSLSAMGSSTIEINPVDIPEVTRLFEWSKSLGGADAAAAASRMLTVKGGGGGLEAPTGALNCLEARIPVKAVKEDAGMGMDGPIHHCRATLGRIKRDDASKLWYAACPGLRDGGRACNKKLTHDPSTDSWSCTSGCPSAVPNFRYILSVPLLDYTGCEYATLFDAEAAQLVKHNANELQRLCSAEGAAASGLPVEVDRMFNALEFKDVLLTTKARLEDRNGEQRVKVTVVKVRDIEPVKESRALISSLKQYISASAPAAAAGAGY